MNKYDYSKQDIINSLKKVGINKNDNLFIHSNIGFFGLLESATVPADYYKIFKEAIFEVIGQDGTIVFPTFSYSFCKKEIFDKSSTKSVCGMLSELARLDKDALRSDDANFSVVAIGKYAKFFTDNSPEYSFGPGSFWDKFLKKEGLFCNLNFDSGSTFIHYVERSLKVDYRFDKAFDGVAIKQTNSNNERFYHFCYDLEKQAHAPEFTKFDKKAKELGLAKSANLGRGQIVSISAKDTFDLIKQELDINPSFLTKGVVEIPCR